MVTIKSEVIVCGAGAAGLPAALAAARAGAEVCIVEEDARIGGATTDQFIQMFCGRPYQGIFRELCDKMLTFAPQKSANTFRLSSFIMSYLDFFKDLPIRIFTRQEIVNVCKDGKNILAVESATHRFEGKVYIDATGDGDVAALAGCPFRYGREAASEFDEAFAPEKADGVVQRCTLMYSVKRLPEAGPDVLKSQAPFDGDEGLIWGPTVVCKDTLDPAQLSEAQNEALSMMPEEVAKWKEKGCIVSSIAPKLGVRESRRIEGLHILSYHDIADERSFPDGICVVKYNIDPWDPDGNPMHDKDRIKLTETPYYEIPYRCLVNDAIDNIITAGRCVSATHVVNSSLRVMGICIPMGQAAGNAAYLAVNAGCAARGVDTGALRDRQRKGGVRVSLSEPEIK
jgi:hypothetical protein